MKVRINQSKCDRSPSCIIKRFCPKEAVQQEKGSLFKGGEVTIDESLCVGCGICTKYCPHSAVEYVE